MLPHQMRFATTRRPMVASDLDSACVSVISKPRDHVVAVVEHFRGIHCFNPRGRLQGTWASLDAANVVPTALAARQSGARIKEKSEERILRRLCDPINLQQHEAAPRVVIGALEERIQRAKRGCMITPQHLEGRWRPPPEDVQHEAHEHEVSRTGSSVADRPDTCLSGRAGNRVLENGRHTLGFHASHDGIQEGRCPLRPRQHTRKLRSDIGRRLDERSPPIVVHREKRRDEHGKLTRRATDD
eukprot:scaffold218437_cov28-Tisochrysis_lutea.AAC.5